MLARTETPAPITEMVTDGKLGKFGQTVPTVTANGRLLKHGKGIHNDPPATLALPLARCRRYPSGRHRGNDCDFGMTRRAFTLIELLCVLAILTILASAVGIASKKLYQRLAWKCNFIASFHNSRIAKAVEGDLQQIDLQLDDGDYWEILKR